MSEHAVVIAGGGPTGLMLAGELAIAGIDVAIVERRADQHVDGSRAGGLHARTLEVLDQRGIVQRFLDAGTTVPSLGYGGIMLGLGDFPTRHNYVLALFQSRFEPILADWVGELGVPIHRSCDVTGFERDDDGVHVQLSDGRTLRASYLVGCDGGRSRVRTIAGIEFAGTDATTSWILAEAHLRGDPEYGIRWDAAGMHAIGKASDGASARIVINEREPTRGDEPSLDDLRRALTGVYGTDFGLQRASWISRFTDMTRQAAAYRSGRVLLAGDAAHVHPPHGGQGLNVGVQDAMNLGWKLARVVNEAAPAHLLDTYHAERHPVGARVLRAAMAQVALSRPGETHQALRDTMAELLTLDEPRRRIAGMISGLDVAYDLGGGHPLVGRRMPDLDLQTGDGPTSVSALLRDAQPVLLHFEGGADAPGVRTVRAAYDDPWELPVLGLVEPPQSVLIRPDGHVAWAGNPTDPALSRALASWFAAT